MHYLYLLVDLCCLFPPLLFSFFPAFQFYKTWKAFFPATVITAVFFIGWDAYFTHLQVWGFNSAYLMSFRFMALPLEEILFFICIPYACVFTYYCVRRYIRSFASPGRMFVPTVVLIIILLAVALIHTQKLYTFTTFVFLILYLIVLLRKKVTYLDRFFLTFLIILPFFFFSNGILTGGFTNEPVVWYNPQHHLSLRLLTIPVEDVFYGMLLLLMNISLYEYFIRKFNINLPKAD